VEVQGPTFIFFPVQFDWGSVVKLHCESVVKVFGKTWSQLIFPLGKTFFLLWTIWSMKCGQVAQRTHLKSHHFLIRLPPHENLLKKSFVKVIWGKKMAIEENNWTCNLLLEKVIVKYCITCLYLKNKDTHW
jgi:hypothetical protein